MQVFVVLSCTFDLILFYYMVQIDKFKTMKKDFDVLPAGSTVITRERHFCSLGLFFNKISLFFLLFQAYRIASVLIQA